MRYSIVFSAVLASTLVQAYPTPLASQQLSEREAYAEPEVVDVGKLLHTREASPEPEPEPEVVDVGKLLHTREAFPEPEPEPEVVDVGKLLHTREAFPEPEPEPEPEVVDVSKLLHTREAFPEPEAEPDVVDVGKLLHIREAFPEAEPEVVDVGKLLHTREALPEPEPEAEPEVVDVGKLLHTREAFPEAEPEVVDVGKLLHTREPTRHKNYGKLSGEHKSQVLTTTISSGSEAYQAKQQNAAQSNGKREALPEAEPEVVDVGKLLHTREPTRHKNYGKLSGEHKSQVLTTTISSGSEAYQAKQQNAAQSNGKREAAPEPEPEVVDIGKLIHTREAYPEPQPVNLATNLLSKTVVSSQ